MSGSWKRAKQLEDVRSMEGLDTVLNVKACCHEVGIERCAGLQNAIDQVHELVHAGGDHRFGSEASCLQASTEGLDVLMMGLCLSAVIVRPAPSLHQGSLPGSIWSDGVRTRLMVCTNGDGAHHEGSNKRVVAKPAAA